MIIFSAVVALTNSVFTVTPSSCASCPHRMRFSADGRSATVNIARVDEKDCKALSVRAFALMEKSACGHRWYSAFMADEFAIMRKTGVL